MAELMRISFSKKERYYLSLHIQQITRLALRPRGSALHSRGNQELDSVISPVEHDNDISGGRSYLDIVDVSLLAMAYHRAMYVTVKVNMFLVRPHFASV
ncbi:hypothetical protein [Streptomyces afghaniensis]|uniref:hypothetical protein n=1 Tax=Streptomyces afghaniensis TaxID=66865 RepID=UPI0027D8CC7C|nr:hypothetical protein [Streptomyces afghaniensis]